MTEKDNLVTVYMNRYELDEASAKYVVDRAAALAKSLKEPDRKANDFALAYHLNKFAIGLFEMVANNLSGLPDVSTINRSYILLVNELRKIYARNAELENISENICWQSFDRLEHIESDVWEYTNYNNNEYGLSHNAQVNRLRISHGKETPDFPPEIKKIVDEAEANGKAFFAKIEDESDVERDWFIPEYTLTYASDGSLLVNGVKGVLKVKKTQLASASAKLMEQAVAKPNELFKPNLGHNYSRTLSVTLSGLGFSGTLRDLFFPQVSEANGVVFRPTITREEVDAEHIDTTKLDDKLKKLGADVVQKPIEIPF